MTQEEQGSFPRVRPDLTGVSDDIRDYIKSLEDYIHVILPAELDRRRLEVVELRDEVERLEAQYSATAERARLEQEQREQEEEEEEEEQEEHEAGERRRSKRWRPRRWW